YCGLFFGRQLQPRLHLTALDIRCVPRFIFLALLFPPLTFIIVLLNRYKKPTTSHDAPYAYTNFILSLVQITKERFHFLITPKLIFHAPFSFLHSLGLFFVLLTSMVSYSMICSRSVGVASEPAFIITPSIF